MKEALTILFEALQAHTVTVSHGKNERAEHEAAASAAGERVNRSLAAVASIEALLESVGIQEATIRAVQRGEVSVNALSAQGDVPSPSRYVTVPQKLYVDFELIRRAVCLLSDRDKARIAEVDRALWTALAELVPKPKWSGS
jgi:hypothetical protein